MGRIVIDFEEHKPSVTRNKYLLVMIDKYSRFPFAFPCADISSHTMIECLMKLFSVFGCRTGDSLGQGNPVHVMGSGRFFSSHAVVMTHATPHHPGGNGLCERENGSIWIGFNLHFTLRYRLGLSGNWPSPLSCTQLLNMAINETPHERLLFPQG